MFFQLFVVLVYFFELSYGVGWDQSSGAFGYLTCNGAPAKDVLVKLYDRDRGMDVDDLLAKTYSDSNGYYELQGYTDEISTIDPMLNFYHSCNNDFPCEKKFRIHIPDDYVTKGQNPLKLFDGGIINLDSEFPNQSYDCIHFWDIGLKSNLTNNRSLIELEAISPIELLI